MQILNRKASWILILILFVTFATISSSAIAETRYTVADLGAATIEVPAGINNSGQIIFLNVFDDGVHPIFWEDGVATKLEKGVAASINDRGQIAGTLYPNNSAFLWENGSTTDLGSLLGAKASNALCINNKGQVLICAVFDDEWHYLIWKDGTVIDLSDSISDLSCALWINDSGEVFGFQSQSGIYWKSGEVTVLSGVRPDVATYYNIRNTGFINDLGRIVGTSQEGTGFLWKNGELIDLGVLPDQNGSSAYCINNYEQIVGVSIHYDYEIMDADSCMPYTPSVVPPPFLWENGVMTNLNDLIDKSSGWELESATYINDRGQIVGVGKINDETHAYLLTPIEPEGLDAEKKTLLDLFSGIPCTPAILFMVGFFALGFSCLSTNSRN